MNARALAHIKSLLESDKFKDRQEGYQAVRDAFRDDAVVHDFEPSDDDKSGPKDKKKLTNSWLFILQVVFGAVRAERAVYLKKGVANATAVSARRFTDAASIVRWLTERSLKYLRKPSVKALVDHLQETMVHRGELLEPVSLDYSKTLRILLSWQQHLDQLDGTRWTHLLHFAFSGVLQTPLRTQGDFKEEDSDNEDNQMDVDIEVASSVDPSSPKGGKRKQSDDDDTPRKRRAVQSNLTLEQIEFAGLVRVLLSGSASPYVTIDDLQFPRNILKRFKMFFIRYPRDTTAHYDMLVALNRVVSHLSLNTLREVGNLGHDIWNSLVASWNSRHHAVKEQLILAFRQLFPYMNHPSDNVTTSEQREAAFDKIRGLWRLLDAEADVVGRGGLEALALDQLRLEISHNATSPRPFVTSCLQSGNIFSEAQALSWVALELQADCMISVSALPLFVSSNFLMVFFLAFSPL